MHKVQDYDSILSTITLLTMLNVWVSILLTCGQHLSSPPVFSEVRVTRFLDLYVCVLDNCLSFCTFSFGHAHHVKCVGWYAAHMWTAPEFTPGF
jgi:hypothetical protein